MAKKSKKASGRKPSQGGARSFQKPSGRSSRGPAREYKRPAAAVNLRPLRILMGVLGLLCLAGLAAIPLIVDAPLPTGSIITMVLLGLIAAVSLFTAARPEPVVALFRRISQ